MDHLAEGSDRQKQLGNGHEGAQKGPTWPENVQKLDKKNGPQRPMVSAPPAKKPTPAMVSRLAGERELRQSGL